MPTIGLITAYFVGKVPGFNPYSTEHDKEIAHFVLFAVFIATGILPVVIAIILKQTKLISSIHMPKKEERSLPFLLTSMCYYGVFYYLNSYLELPIDKLISYFILAGVLATILGFMVTLSWKISVHMIGVGGIVGILTVLSKVGDEVLILPLSISLIIAGLVGFGRLQLNAHTPKQVLAGFFLGFFCEILGLIVAN